MGPMGHGGSNVVWACTMLCGSFYASLCAGGCGDAKDDAASAVGAAKALMEAAKEMKQAGEAADQAAKAAEEKARAEIPQGASEEEAKQFVEQAKAIAAMQAMHKAGGQGPITHWRQLQGFLPDALGDWKAAGKLKGSTTKAGGFEITSVERPYALGERRAKITITDTFLSPVMRAPFKMAAIVQEDSTEGYKKGTRIGGHTAIVEWREASKRSKAMVLVGERFMLDVSVQQTGQHDDAVALAQTLELGALAEVKGEETAAPPEAAAAPAARPAEPAKAAKPAGEAQ